MKFSVIVPSYNSERYIAELLDSLKNQTIDKQQYEVLLVDDCSTDRTLDIAKSYQDKMNLTIKRLEQNSGGPGKPRNTALKIAQGEFVFFVDSDDYIHKDTLKDVNKFIELNHDDVILVKMEGVNGRGVPKSMFTETNGDVVIENSRIIYTLSPTKFYRTALLRAHDIYFPEHIRSAEDQVFTMQAYVNASKIGVLADKSYYYATRREGEHMSAAYVTPKDYYQTMRLIVRAIKESQTLNNNDKVLRIFVERHFSFSRTTRFSLRIAHDKQAEWMDAIGDFIREIPERIDQSVNDNLKPLLYYARKKDLSHYQKVEAGYQTGEIYDIKAHKNSLTLQFGEGEPYFHFENAIKPDIKMTDFTFDEKGFNLEIEYLKTLINPNQLASKIQLKLISRNKKEFIYVPLTVNDATRFKFNISLNALIPYLLKERTWDLFLEMRIDQMTITKRIGNKRSQYRYDRETSTIIENDKKYYRFTPYFTKDFDNLSFYIIENKLTQMLKPKLIGKQQIQLECLEFNYILKEGLATIKSDAALALGYLSMNKERQTFNYQIEIPDKVKVKNLKEPFNIELADLSLEF
ncbi:glycosyltransferase family 2 protein [Staphylococcus gallinarum]|uniref:Glycosyltransferase family 2 protein n=1 Tax=Staphylococcus gallinarum TaxID=1293 RepID=A0A3A0W695_STAGA|nr:glycosyltransferase family 2 protein [Staphylococcus gallinarum]RIP37217.1 glycosyltransferase family 2 protein [Staphylococcus gallinarum]